MPNDYFRFKQFTVYHDKCAMKVGTDAVLLGAWAEVEDKKNILDIGTGTGIISLMLAQRCNSRIIAVDIDEGAVEQVEVNVAQSPWADRIEIERADVRLLSQDVRYANSFDVIVSNPPYFQEDVKCPENQRNTARHTDTLDFAGLLKSVAALLKLDGSFSVVLPANVSADFITLAVRSGLNLSRQTWVHTKEGKMPKRVLMSFCKGKVESSIVTHLNMISQDGHKNEEYQKMVDDFYL